MKKYRFTPIILIALLAFKSEQNEIYSENSSIERGSKPFFYEAKKQDADKAKQFSYVKTISLRSQNEMMENFTKQGISEDIFLEVYNALKPLYFSDELFEDTYKKFTFEWEEKSGIRTLNSLHFPLDGKTTIHVLRQENKKFVAFKIERPTVKRILRADVITEFSLPTSAARKNIPYNIMNDFFKLFSWDIDFERDITKGDKISLLYSCEFDKITGERLICEDILFASISRQIENKIESLYAYQYGDNQLEYYSKEGFSLKKTFMKTPIAMGQVRISTHSRRHNPLGYSETHRAFDFFAPTGTPIYAAADGIISQRGRSRDEGNVIVLNHGKYITRYLHMLKFGKGQKIDQYVKQGDIIGYVGTTGRSTWPHLHYEMRLANSKKALNPLELKTVPSLRIQDNDIEAFRAKCKEIDELYISLEPNNIPSPEEILVMINGGSVIKKD